MDRDTPEKTGSSAVKEMIVYMAVMAMIHISLIAGMAMMLLVIRTIRGKSL